MIFLVPFQVQTQPKPSEEPKPAVEASLNHHVNALWNEQIPICIEVIIDTIDSFSPSAYLQRYLQRYSIPDWSLLYNDDVSDGFQVLLAPDCADCYQALSRVEEDSSYDRLAQPRALLLERWSMRALVSKYVVLSRT